MEQGHARPEVQVRAEDRRGQATLREGDDQLQEQEGRLLNSKLREDKHIQHIL